MKFQTLLLPLLAFILLPILTVVGALYFSTSTPVGTFRAIEKQETIVEAPQNISQIKSNGTVRVNNLA